MSQAPHEATNVPNAGFDTGDYQYPPQSAQNQGSHGVSNFVDGSGPIFSMYMEMATEEDKKMAENWKADADGILIFTGLFSAAVASLISVSIQDIRPNPQDTSNFYLANIYQTVSDPNQPNNSLPSSPLPFSPPTYAVWVNSLWFLSLVISLTCALLATLLQQWARRYLKRTQSRYGPHKQARIRAFFAEGVEKLLLPWTVEILPALLHISLFLFFAGLIVFLCNVNITIFKLVLSWVGVCTALYGCITFMPIFRHDSPYYTSLSSLVWLVVIGIVFIGSQVRLWFSLSLYYPRPLFWRIRGRWHKLLFQGMWRTAEETALNSPSEIDTRAFVWTFDSLDEDHELERFFSGLPGFRSSKVIDDPLPSLTSEEKGRLSTALIGLFDRTFSSDLLPEPVKNRRAIICAKALDPVEFPYAYWDILRRVMSGDQRRGLQTAEFVRVMRGWGRGDGDIETGSVAQAIFTTIVARAQRRGDSWLISAPDELGIPEADLRDYVAHGNSLSLASLIHITRHQFSHYRKSSWPVHRFEEVLGAASEFDAQDTPPELQHEFCALWNEIVLKAQDENERWLPRRITWNILRPIRNIYLALHRDTNSSPTRFSTFTGDWDGILWGPSSYLVCNVPGHIRDNSASTSFARTVLHDNAALTLASIAGPNTPPLSVLAPLDELDVDENVMDVPPLDHAIDVPGLFPRLLHPVHQTAIENLRIPATSQDPVTAHAIQSGIDTSTITVPLSTPEPSASTPTPTSMTSASPPGIVAAQDIAYNRLSTDVLDASSLPVRTPVIDDMPPTAPAAPGRSHSRQSSAPDPGASVEGEGGAKAALHKHKEEDIVDPPSAIRENIMTTPDIPSQLPSPQLS